LLSEARSKSVRRRFSCFQFDEQHSRDSWLPLHPPCGTPSISSASCTNSDAERVAAGRVNRLAVLKDSVRENWRPLVGRILHGSERLWSISPYRRPCFRCERHHSNEAVARFLRRPVPPCHASA